MPASLRLVSDHVPARNDFAHMLLDHLRNGLKEPQLAWSEPPVRLPGGFETEIFAVRLKHAPGAFARPLIVRVFREFHDRDRPRWETAVLNAIADMGYPAPRVLMTVTDESLLGHRFIVMERMPGVTLAEGFEGLGRGRNARELLTLLWRMPQMLRQVTTKMAEAQARLHELPVEPLLDALRSQGLSSDAVTFAARLERIRKIIERENFGGLQPALSWLLDHRPAEPVWRSICHGDFQPFNILFDAGTVTGVIDWGRVSVGDPAQDVGASMAVMAAVPIEAPRLLQGIFYGIIRVARRRYYRAYCRLRSLDTEKVRYYQGFRCMEELVFVADGLRKGHRGLGGFQSADGIRRLLAHVLALTGIELTFPVPVVNEVTLVRR